MSHDHEDAKNRLRRALERMKAAKATGDPLSFAHAARTARLLLNEVMPKLERDVAVRGQKPDSEVGGMLNEFAALVDDNANWGRSGKSQPRTSQRLPSPGTMSMTKVGRNEPCPCGSGRKYKRCHGSSAAQDVQQEREDYGAFGRNPVRESVQKLPAKNPGLMMARIEAQRRAGTRQLPSDKLYSIGEEPLLEDRKFLIDSCAKLVDQNYAGRSEMCAYFAVLLRDALSIFGHAADVEIGKASYRYAGSKVFTWDHAWVRTSDGQIIDGNIDSVVENPMVPVGVEPLPYWGPVDQLPPDRSFEKSHVLPPERDLIELDAEPTNRWKRAIGEELGRRRGAV